MQKNIHIILFFIILTACASVNGNVEIPATAIPTETITPTFSSQPTITSAPTMTRTLTPIKPISIVTETFTPVPTYTLSGTVFFDDNGNGQLDDGELPIEGVTLTINDLSSISGDDSKYVFDGLIAGYHQVYVKSFVHPPFDPYRYISLSSKAFQPIEEPIAINLDSNITLNIALMQGFLTIPIPKEVNFKVGSYYDHIIGSGVENWMGNATLTGNDHIGTDFRCLEGTSIVAAAPGVVVK